MAHSSSICATLLSHSTYISTIAFCCFAMTLAILLLTSMNAASCSINTYSLTFLIIRRPANTLITLLPHHPFHIQQPQIVSINVLQYPKSRLIRSHPEGGQCRTAQTHVCCFQLLIHTPDVLFDTQLASSRSRGAEPQKILGAIVRIHIDSRIQHLSVVSANISKHCFKIHFFMTRRNLC